MAYSGGQNKLVANIPLECLILSLAITYMVEIDGPTLSSVKVKTQHDVNGLEGLLNHDHKVLCLQKDTHSDMVLVQP